MGTGATSLNSYQSWLPVGNLLERPAPGKLEPEEGGTETSRETVGEKDGLQTHPPWLKEACRKEPAPVKKQTQEMDPLKGPNP